MNIQTVATLVAAMIAFVFGSALGFYLRRKLASKKIADAERLTASLLKDASVEAANMKEAAIIEGKEEVYQSRTAFDRDQLKRNRELEKLERQIQEKDLNVGRKLDLVEKKERELVKKSEELFSRDRNLKLRDERLEKVVQEQNVKLERIAALTSEEAKRELINNLEKKARLEASQIVKDIKEEAKRTADREAKKIISGAIQRCATDHVTETTVSVVSLPNDEIKGRIIGREGRNIRSFELATGIDVIIDDTPEAVILSGFDPVRREVARIALEKLITDGRIHPGRIEDVVKKSRIDLDKVVREIGEEIVYELGLTGIHRELIVLLGKLKYRTSNGQNLLQHCKEVALLAGMMAAELGLDEKLARRAGLLHDIGRAVDHEFEGEHARVGADIVSKHNEPEIVADTLAAHHDGIPHRSMISVLVQASDGISKSRPGAKRETLETFVKRLERLEEIADSFEGVYKAYAIQAGREVRVLVDPEDLADTKVPMMAEELAKRIERQMEYPGQIKVTVIRETRSVEYAK